jgi:hypothetical protein
MFIADPIGPEVAGDDLDEYKTRMLIQLRAIIAKVTEMLKPKAQKKHRLFMDRRSCDGQNSGDNQDETCLIKNGLRILVVAISAYK